MISHESSCNRTSSQVELTKSAEKNLRLESLLGELKSLFEALRNSQLGRFALFLDRLSGRNYLQDREALDSVKICTSEARPERTLPAGLDDLCIEQLESRNAQKFSDLQALYARVDTLFPAPPRVLVQWLELALSLFMFRSPVKAPLNALFRDVKDFQLASEAGFADGKNQMKGRMGMLLQVWSYFIRNPVASFRLLNWERLKRLIQVLAGAEALNSLSWIDQRFPVDTSASKRPQTFLVAEDEAPLVQLVFPCVDSPRVSIVIPVYNQYATTISCLQSVLANTADIDYEVIIADDCSSDSTITIGERAANVRVVRHKENQGFLGNCNTAVRQARGDFVLLLNNDTNPQQGWLTKLLETFDQHQGVGLVGPKLLFEDGVLQEAGGIIWRDGSGWNYGRGQSPDAPEFNYVRDVDYVSGACILLKKEVWQKIGGFDERFRPAYYEDTDLAFEIRRLGLRTVYQPASEVVHFEGVSHGNDINSGVKKQQRINQVVFRKKWSKALLADHNELGSGVFNARERHLGGKTILFIDHYVPFFDKDAGSRSTYLYVKTMLEMGYRVKFLGANFFPHKPYTEALQQLGVEVLYGERFARNWKLWLRENAKHIDVIYLHRPHITEDFITEIKSLEDCPELVYFGHDLHFLRTEREAGILQDASLKKSADDWKRRERRIFEQVDKVLYPSNVEVEAVRKLAPQTDVAQLPLYVLDEPASTEFRFQNRKDLLFVGGFTHTPNVDAVLWFAEQVLPNLLEVDPDIQLHVVGSNVPSSVHVLASKNIVVHGFVSDAELENLYRSIRVCVVPLRYGAGVKGKVLEALQSNVPLVTTPIGAEGIPEPASVMCVVEGAKEFSAQVLSLYQNERRCIEMLESRSEYIRRHFSKPIVKEAIEQYFGAAPISSDEV
ncbi:glycosyltransferase [Microbulbifer agarilyticus]|uniref:glycosyltransferase n=1 Tax=Microbulbifer agarilyticus TaxID=260552 RepID=UPI001C98C8FC|nr:glycosyltransferase [Microbulbifer agarilyticus]MBY6212243.1 glycosyltransferase [Microbulbifer agarilyticus]